MLQAVYEVFARFLPLSTVKPTSAKDGVQCLRLFMLSFLLTSVRLSQSCTLILQLHFCVKVVASHPCSESNFAHSRSVTLANGCLEPCICPLKRTRTGSGSIRVKSCECGANYAEVDLVRPLASVVLSGRRRKAEAFGQLPLTVSV